MGVVQLSEQEILKTLFLSLQEPRDVATFLGFDYGNLNFLVNRIPVEKRYIKFNIAKRSGKPREIYSPISAIKSAQRKLSEVLYLFYKPQVGVHGYVKGNNIKSNAQIHAGQKQVLNIDLKDFFPSINLGRVYGIFKAPFPFNFNRKVSGFLANICCHENKLPQGAPTSPIISNFICIRLDVELLKIAISNKCYYSRYADDITLSTSEERFPDEIMTCNSDGKILLSEKIISTIEQNGFFVNTDKIRFRNKFQRKEVTGLVVNSFVNVKRDYIREVRAILNACEVYGLPLAEKIYYEKYDLKYRKRGAKKPLLKNILQGRINYIKYIRKRGGVKKETKDFTFEKLDQKYKKVVEIDKAIPTYIEPEERANTSTPLIITEGKTDWMHLKNALEALKALGKFKNLLIDFWEYHDEVHMSDSQLRSFCLKQSAIKKNKPYICIFDRDSEKIVREMSGGDHLDYKRWNESVFSFCIPKPSFRNQYENVSIEFFYTDDEIHTVDSSSGKQLLFTNEVEEIEIRNPTTGQKIRKTIKLKTPKQEDELRKKIYALNTHLIVDEISGRKIAYSKTAFAEDILNKKTGFDKFELKEFEKIFQIIEAIILVTKN